MSDPSRLPYGGAGDSRTGGLSLADRFRRHADSLVRSGRSPLYVTLMRAAAEDIDADGAVARVFDGIPTPPGSLHFEQIRSRLRRTVQTTEPGRAPPDGGPAGS